ncbi:MAG: exonuclease SbcCD subunit D [Lachnospiraceae bacterium]|nr:exonuclease SbcCD subunit D [Lachnospiraceae bacterium]
MKFLHLADLHFGKSIHGVSLLERGDQKAWAASFLELAGNLRPDAVLIAGDVYDRSAPPGDAVALLSDMLTDLADMGIPVMMIAGNHDSGQRLSFGESLLAKQNVHISGVLSRELTHVTLQDPDGPVTFWLMPYVFPALVAQKLEDDGIREYDTAVRRLLACQDMDLSRRNVLIAHQNVTAHGKEVLRGGSESMVGGVGQVDYHVFDSFDYVALGHIHSSYPVGRESVRYAGSPLCYHFEETRQPAKGPLLVELGPKGAAPKISVQTIAPLHPLRRITGAYEEIRDTELSNASRGEYLSILLTDRRVTPEISAFFRSLFGGRDSILMELASEHNRFGDISSLRPADAAAEKPVEELFLDFYSERCGGQAPSDPEQALLAFVGEQIRHADPAEGKGMTGQKEIDALLAFALEQEENE